MKNPFKISTILAALALVLFGCQKFEPEGIANLPDSVALGKSVVYLNGELVDYIPEFKSVDLQADGMIMLLIETNKGVQNGLLNFITLDTGRVNNRISFSQSQADHIQHSYEPKDSVSNYTVITAIDRVGRTIEGRFQAKFERVSTGIITTSNNLPTELFFQGVFHEKF